MDIRNSLLDFFIKNPGKEFHVRQLAKLLKKSPTTISKFLKEFEKKNILRSERKLNHLFFRSKEDKEFKSAKLSHNLTMILKSGVVNYIEDKIHPEAIILFGSYAKAENELASDVDLLAVSSSKEEVNLDKFEKKLGHKIHLFIHSNKDIEKMMRVNKELLNSWINGIVVYGFWEAFK